jgi:farnesyl-diphosphate farnesyltransferase
LIRIRPGRPIVGRWQKAKRRVKKRSEKRFLLEGILKQVSRSFYLTLRVLPPKLRDQIGLAYLFCRAADTIADTELIPPTERLKYLYLFREQFTSSVVSPQSVLEIKNKLAHYQGDTAERTLLSQLEGCFGIFEEFPIQDQERIRSLVGILTKGMEMDLTFFPAEDSGTTKALPSVKDLDQYCYYVAGVVGTFWTQMLIGHFAAFQSWDPERMQRLGIHFGKGLQLTNLIKDVSSDLARGRCYVPQSVLDEFNISSEGLKNNLPAAQFSPVLAHLIRLALYHLEGGWQYILAIPRRHVRLRLACLWPHLFAIQTLQRIYDAEDLLHPKAVVKISRGEVYSIMAMSTLMACSNRMLSRYYNRLRRGLVSRILGE